MTDSNPTMAGGSGRTNTTTTTNNNRQERTPVSATKLTTICCVYNTEMVGGFALVINRLLVYDRLVGLVVKASASRAEDPGFDSRLRRDFFGVESYQ